MLSFVYFRAAKNLIVSGYSIRYLKRCSVMCIIERVFHYEETELPVIKYKDEIWFRGKTVAEILGYAIQRKAIREHVDPEDKVRLTELRGRRTSKSKGSKTDPLKEMRATLFILMSLGYTV